LIFLQVIRAFLIFVNGGSMTNTKVYQGFLDDLKVEEHWTRGLRQLFSTIDCQFLELQCTKLVLNAWFHSYTGSKRVKVPQLHFARVMSGAKLIWEKLMFFHLVHKLTADIF